MSYVRSTDTFICDDCRVADVAVGDDQIPRGWVQAIDGDELCPQCWDAR